ncbi:GGDEF domain-containing protein [Botrimarina hoheduenensis]|uniref:Putative diguanylate cyclase YegE n=1 Tax=Botrimarina hoheduenensis TaxID=2528000 RepID=A0A5C5WF48_9BACT|nr:GGDEF domain-containing protein [Botrimarina hoheduenensis]TWT48719.1 putative diguanylate cyclase YegE [Botrimarina hoheduenensis]
MDPLSLAAHPPRPIPLALLLPTGAIAWANEVFTQLPTASQVRLCQAIPLTRVLEPFALPPENGWSFRAEPIHTPGVRAPDLRLTECGTLWLLCGLPVVSRATLAESNDPVTGLAPRAVMDECLAEWTGPNGPACFALVFIDVDDFKGVNDRFGHQQGDATLREIAQRLQATVRSDDVVARFGGDEFVLLLRGIEPGGGWRKLKKRLIARLNEPFETEGNAYHSPGSLGVAFFNRSDPRTATELIAVADRAMYADKPAR